MKSQIYSIYSISQIYIMYVYIICGLLLNNSPLVFHLSPDKIILMESLVKEMINARNVKIGAHILDRSLCGGSWRSDF